MVRRERLGEHREDRRAGVDGAGVPRGVRVERGPLGHQRVHVGDSDSNADVPVREPLGDLDLIEVARLGYVVESDDHGSDRRSRAHAGRIDPGGRQERRLPERGLRDLRRETRVEHRLPGAVNQVESRHWLLVARVGGGAVGARIDGLRVCRVRVVRVGGRRRPVWLASLPGGARCISHVRVRSGVFGARVGRARCATRDLLTIR